ncbi:MAG: aldehyde dehydrogenase family protein [Conexibacter sp.]
MQTVRSVVDGDPQGGGTPSQSTNPARPDEVVAEVRLGDAVTAANAVEAAQRAFAGWRATPAGARGAILARAGRLLEERAEAIGRDLAREEGKTLAEAIGETRRAAAILGYFGAQTLDADGETYPSSVGGSFLFARRRPLGVVAAITPWNFPIAIPAWKIAPALAFGNTVVWKPAEIVPLTALHLLDALTEAGLPAGVLNLVIGRGSVVGGVLGAHPGIAAVTFTGSNGVGRRLQAAATEAGKKVQLELGGKNPAIVLEDADLGLAVEQIARGAFLSAGQKCTATSRVVVERGVAGELVERLAETARGWRVGDPLDGETQVGPVASREQRDGVAGYLELAVREGGTFAAGGPDAERPDEGWYVPLSVVRGLAPDSRTAREEVFGPLVAVLEADDPAHALALANDTPYGLTASIFTNDLERAMTAIDALDVGVVKVNQESAGLELHVPFGGMKESSSGSREQGKVARDFFTQWKTVYLDAPPRD